MEEKSKYRYVFSMKLAGNLMINGFKLLRVNKHLSRNGFDVYVFEDSDEINSFIENYKKSKEK